MNKNKIIIILWVLLFSVVFLLGADNVSAADTYYYVSTTGDDGHDGLTWPTAKLTIQNAVDTADVGDTVLVADGTYSESVTVDKGLAISSQNGPDNCIVQTPDPSENVFTITESNVKIIGFTAEGAIGNQKAGVYLASPNPSAPYTDCVIENVIANNNYYGIYLKFVSNNTLLNNTTNFNIYGIYSYALADSNDLIGNIANFNDKTGIYLNSSSGNTLTGNTMSGNEYNLQLMPATYYNDIDTTNTVEGKPIYYLHSEHGTAEVPLVYDGDEIGDIGMFWCINSSYVQVKNATLSPNNRYGVYFDGTGNSTIENIAANSNDYSIYLKFSSNNNLIGNITSSSYTHGIYLLSSSGNTLTGNTMSGNTYNLYVAGAYDNNIDNTNMVEGKPVYYLYDEHGTAEVPLVYDGDEIGDIGMFWCINSSYVQVKNATLSPRNRYCVYFGNTSNSTIENITVNSNRYGIYLNSSSNDNLIMGNTVQFNEFGIYLNSSSNDNQITENTVYSNKYGIYLNSSSSNTLTGNIISKNRNDIYNTGTINTYSSNRFNDNMLSKMLTFTDADPRTKNVDDTVSFGISAFNLDGTDCEDCTAITTSPSETITADNNWAITNNPQGHFTVTKPGTYSLIFTVTDENLNTTKRRILFFVGDIDTQTTTYYFRGINPTHGQSLGSIYDSKSLYLEPPTSMKVGWCARFVITSPEEIPDYPLANLSDIDSYIWYKTFDPGDEAELYIGIEQYASFLEKGVEGYVEKSLSIPFSLLYIWINRTLTDINWVMDYPQSWYWLSLKIKGLLPYWTTFPDTRDDTDNDDWDYHMSEYGQLLPSRTEFTYEYATTPAIKSISDENIMVLSATADANDTGIISIIFEDSLTSDTSIMDIVLSSPVRIDLSFDAWNTSAPYYKQWTEEAGAPGITATHTINGLTPNNYYAVTKDGVLLGLYLSDSLGRVTFEAIAGSVFAVSGVETIFDTGGDDDDDKGKKWCFIATASYGAEMSKEVRTLRSFRNEYLLTNPIGEKFVSIYYRASPPIARFIEESPILKNIVRKTLAPLIWVSEKSVK